MERKIFNLRKKSNYEATTSASSDVISRSNKFLSDHGMTLKKSEPIRDESHDFPSADSTNQFNYDVKFDTNRSLVDQIKSIDESIDHFSSSFSSIDSYLNSKRIRGDKDAIAALAKAKFKRILYNDLATDRCVRINSFYDYLTLIGGSSVPLHAFNHVVFKYKKNMRSISSLTHHSSITSSSLNSNGLVANESNTNNIHVSSSTTTTNPINSNSISNVNSNITSSSMNIITNHNFIKLEYVYGSNFFWIVKVRKCYENLYQLKFIKSFNQNLNSQNANKNKSNKSNATNSHKMSKLASFNSFDSTLDQSQTNMSLNDSAILKNSISIDQIITNNISNNNNNDRSQNDSAQLTNNSKTNNNIKNNLFFFTTSSIESDRVIGKYLKRSGWSKKVKLLLRRPSTPKFSTTLFNSSSFQFDFFDKSDCEEEENNEEDDNGLFTKLFNDLDSQESNASKIFNYYEQNCFCELQSEKDPKSVNIVRIKKNISGRLLLQNLVSLDNQVWIFHLNSRVHPIGWAKLNEYKYDPIELDLIRDQESSISNLLVDLDSNKRAKLTALLDHDHESLHKHDFKVNYLMECLYENKFYVAKVVEIINEYYFKVKLDVALVESKRVEMTIVLHKNSMNLMRDNTCHLLFPAKWCLKHNLNIVPPLDWISKRGADLFDWDVYLKDLNSSTDSTSDNKYVEITDWNFFSWSINLNQLSLFEPGFYLECIDPLNRSNICLAQIRARVDHLLFLKLIRSAKIKLNLQHVKQTNVPAVDSTSDLSDLLIISCDSTDIYPIGWCEMNNYFDEKVENNDFAPNINLSELGQAKDLDQYKNVVRLDFFRIPNLNKFNHLSDWCECIFLNTNFNCGPNFKKSSLERLPSCFGPGPVALVLAQLIKCLISKSDNYLKLIKIIQKQPKRISNINQDASKYPCFNYRIKKSDKLTYKSIQVCSNVYQLNEYLNDLCFKLKCCNKFISTRKLGNDVCKKESLLRKLNCCPICTLNFDETLINMNDPPCEAPKQPVTKNTKQRITKESNSDLKNPKINKRSLLYSLRPTTSSENTLPVEPAVTIKSRRLLKASEKLPNAKPVVNEIVKAKEKSKRKTTEAEEPPVAKKQKTTASKKVQKKEPKIINGAIKSNTNSIDDQGNCLVYFKNPNDPNLYQQNYLSPITYYSQLPCSPIQNKNEIANTSNINEMNLIYRFNLSNNTAEISSSSSSLKPNVPTVQTNPIKWSTSELINFLRVSNVDASVIDVISEEEIDGQSFMMLTLSTIQNYMKLKFGPAIKLANLVENLKLMHSMNFENE